MGKFSEISNSNALALLCTGQFKYPLWLAFIDTTDMTVHVMEQYCGKIVYLMCVMQNVYLFNLHGPSFSSCSSLICLYDWRVFTNLVLPETLYCILVLDVLLQNSWTYVFGVLIMAGFKANSSSYGYWMKSYLGLSRVFVMN